MGTDRTRTPGQDFTETRNEEREGTQEAREQKVISTRPPSVSSLPILPFFHFAVPMRATHSLFSNTFVDGDDSFTLHNLAHMR